MIVLMSRVASGVAIDTRQRDKNKQSAKFKGKLPQLRENGSQEYLAKAKYSLVRHGFMS